MPGTSSDPASGSNPAPKFQWDNVTFKVGDRHFRVARQELVKESPVFESMFSLPDGDESGKVEGQTDDNPVILEGYESEDFEALLRLLYPTLDDLIKGSIDLTKSQWIGALKLSTIWEMEKARKLAILTLSTDAFNLTPIEKITLARGHRVGPWLEEGLTSLVEGHLDLSLNDLEAAIGLRTAFRIAGMRAKGASPNTLLPKNVAGTLYPTFPFGDLKCKHCSGSAFKGSFNCHACNAKIALHEEGAVFVRSSSDSSVKTNSSFVFYAIELRDLFCASCQCGLIKRSISCTSCRGTVQTNGHVMFPLRSLGLESRVGHTDVRGVFADEFEELGY